MLVGNQTISQKDMPSYVSPDKQPYHLYQMAQDMLNSALDTPMMAQPVNPSGKSAENKPNQWSGK